VVLEIPPGLTRQLEAVAARTAHPAQQHQAKKPPLAGLDWMDGYSGQSTEELLAFANHERLDLLAAAFEEGIREKIQKTGSWNGVERTVVAVMALERAVQTDGFDGFFRNSSRRHALVIAGDLERIGCRAVANIARKAVDALGLRHLTARGIETAMNQEDRKRDRIFAQCDIAFYKRSRIPKRVVTYIKANRGGISF
jgi:hypothetical protein